MLPVVENAGPEHGEGIPCKDLEKNPVADALLGAEATTDELPVLLSGDKEASKHNE